MKYASAKDCPALSPVVRPRVILLVCRDTRSWACATSFGFTPARSRRAFSAARPSVSRSSPMSSSDDTFDARYSAVPASSSESDSNRNPSIRRAPTSLVSESSTPGAPGMRPTTTKPRVESSRAATAAPNVVVVLSTTTSRLTPPPWESNTGTRKTAAKNTGPSMAITQNDFLRTRSTNSRRMTAWTLLTGRSVARHLRADQVDEDLVERRLLELEAREPGARRHQPCEHALRVRAGCELELGVLTVIVDSAHELLICKHVCCSTGVAVEPDDEMVSTMCPLDVAKRTVHQLPSTGDDAQLLAQPLGLLHDVRGEEDGLATAVQIEHHVFHYLSVDGIETREGLVQDHEVGVVQHRRNELHLLLHPLRQLVDAAQSPLGQAEPLEPCLGPLARPPPVDAFHLAQEDEHVEHPHLAIQAALLREIADPLRVGAPTARLPEYPHRTAVGLQNVHDHADGRRLSGAIRPEQAVDHATGDGKRQLINSGVTGEALADPVEGQDQGRGGGGGGG